MCIVYTILQYMDRVYHGRQCTYNVTLGGFRVTIAAVEK